MNSQSTASMAEQLTRVPRALEV